MTYPSHANLICTHAQLQCACGGSQQFSAINFCHTCNLLHSRGLEWFSKQELLELVSWPKISDEWWWKLIQTSMQAATEQLALTHFLMNIADMQVSLGVNRSAWWGLIVSVKVTCIQYKFGFPTRAVDYYWWCAHCTLIKISLAGLLQAC